MTTEQSYHVYSNDAFVHTDFPEVTSELERLNASFQFTIDSDNLSNFILWLKGTVANSIWMYANPLKHKIGWTEHFRPVHIQRLFQACLYNESFRKALEQYIRQRLVKKAPEN